MTLGVVFHHLCVCVSWRVLVSSALRGHSDAYIIKKPLGRLFKIRMFGSLELLNEVSGEQH